MVKRTLWFVCLSLLCCLSAAFVVRAAQKAGQASDKSTFTMPVKGILSESVATPRMAPQTVKPSLTVPGASAVIRSEEREIMRVLERFRKGALRPGDKTVLERHFSDADSPNEHRHQENPLDDNGGTWFGWTGTLAIPDEQCPTLVTAPIVVSGVAPVTLDIEVKIDWLTHNWVGDLRIYLRGPNGVQIELSTNNGFGGDHYINTVFDDEAAISITQGSAPFTGSYIPEGPLSTYDGIDPNGTWTMELCDAFASVSGVLVGWQIQILASAAPPTGRCCYGDPGNPSCVNTPLADCDALGGTWSDGLTCEADPCPVTGSGETCANAIPLVPGTTYTGTTVGYANDYDYLGSTGAPDVVYSYTPIETELVSLRLCGSSYNTFLYFYDTDCATTPVNYNDDSDCGGGNLLQSTLSCQNLLAGHTYYIVVDGNGSSSGDYSLIAILCPSCPAPVNDDCEGVTQQLLPATFTGARDCATPDCPLFAQGQGNVWIAFTVNEASNIMLDYCETTGGTGNAWLNLAIGCPCIDFTSTAVYNWTDCADGNITMQWTNIPAGTYYYPVLRDDANGASGEYTIHVSAESYANPVGRCCHGDVHSPTCEMLTASECESLGGIWNEPLDCSSPCPVPPPCQANPIWSQYATLPSNSAWGGYISDIASGSRVFDDFSGLALPIGSLRVWGYTSYFDVIWYPCAEDPMPFTIQFFSDDGWGHPNLAYPVCTYNLTAPGTPTGLVYPGALNWELMQYDLTLPTPCVLSPGWVSVAGGGDPSCFFLWHNSQDGDSHNWQAQPAWYDWLADQAVCFTTAPCDPATELTVLRQSGPGEGVNITFWAPVAGNYHLFKTAVKNNDGDPNGGADPDWYLLTTIVAVAGFNNTLDAPIDLYNNYVVVHDCQPPAPLGRCCYGDIFGPSCVGPVSQAECNNLSGAWTYTLDCTTPCPVPNPGEWCINAIPLTVPGSVDGSTTSYINDYDAVCGFTGSTAPDVVYAYTPIETEFVTLSLCGGITNYDTKLYVYAGSCASGTQIACSDDLCNSPFFPQFYISRVDCVPMTAGTTYYIVVDGYGAESGSYTLAASVCDGPQYCAALHETCEEYIGNVTFGTINHTTGCTAGGYNDYTAISTNLTIGVGEAMAVTNPEAFTNDATSVWVDWNNNSLFTDAGEQTDLLDDGTGGFFTGMITPPAGSAGTHRMRIRLGFSWTPVPCGVTDYGETEDYTVIVN